MRLLTITVALIISIVFASMGCSSDTDDSASPADFYDGRTIDLIVSASVGGSTDRVAQVVKSYLERDTGADVVITYKKGTGGLEGMNYVYRCEPDGLTLGMASTVKVISNKVLDEPAASYNIEEFSYILNVGNDPYCLLISPDSSYQTIAELQAGDDLIIGGSSPSGAISLGGLTVIELLNLDARLVTGMKEESARQLAVKRGEIAGYVVGVESARPGIDSELVKPMFVLSTKRMPGQPDIPAITELADISSEDMALLELWATSLVSSDLLVGPPGMPEDRLEYLNGLFAELIQDEEFRDEISAAAGSEIDEYGFTTGDAMKAVMQELSIVLEDFRAIFNEMIDKYRA